MKVFISNYASNGTGIGKLLGFDTTQAVFGNHPGRLADFDLCVLDYSDAFDRANFKSQFDKQLIEAMDRGTSVCFTHYNEATPGPQLSDGYVYKDNVTQCINKLPGFMWHHANDIGIASSSFPYLTGSCLRNEFTGFFRKWGVSHNFFTSFNGHEFEDVLYKSNDDVVAFVAKYRQGFLFYIPFQKHGLPGSQIEEAIGQLISSISTYLTKRSLSLPTWAKAPLFKEEESHNQMIAELEAKLEKEKESLHQFDKVKALAVSGEHSLEIELPKFIESDLGIRTRRNEEFIEDFWLVGPDEKDCAICEIKSISKGFKKGFIYDAYNHREKRGFDETFPAVLFVNANLQSTSWKEKDVSIPAAEQKIAAENNVLILRLEDLVRLWDMTRLKKIDSAYIRKLLTTNRGWCSVSAQHEINIFPKSP